MGNQWALILGASSGFGGACSRALARAGYNICGIHLDLKQTLPMAKEVIADVEAAGVKALFINMNAADEGRRQKALDKLDEELKSTDPRAYVHVMLHSLAFGTLLPFIAEKPEDAISPTQMDMTLNVMGHSLVYWVQDLVRRGMLTRGSRVFSMTSAGSHRVFVGYGTVSAAKATLESHTRQLALELGPQGILVNCLQAGVTITPALRRIPNSDILISEALQRNPGGRLTRPEDVATALVTLCNPDLTWISGTILKVDGGEDNV